MKRIVSFLLLLCLAATFTGCALLGGNGDGFLISKTVKYDRRYRIGDVPLDNTRDGDYLYKGKEDRPVYDNIIMELMDLTPDKLTESYKADLSKRLELYHYEYHWNDDNSLTVISEGEEMIFGKTKDWPTSPEWVKRIPVPAHVIVKEAETDESSVRLTVSMTIEEAKAYAEQLKAAGFTTGAMETDMVGYSYSGTDPEGYTARITYTSLVQMIEFTYCVGEDDPGDGPEISHELPKKGLIENLPALPSGKVESVIDDGDSLTISLSGVSPSDGSSFAAKCKAKFNSYVISDTSSDGMLMYVGINDRDVTCSVVFLGEMLNVSLSK